MSRNNLGDMGQKLIELTGDLIAVSTKEGFFLAISPEWENVLGFSIDEIRKKTFINFVHPEDQQITYDCLGSLVLGMDVKNFRNRYVTKDGSIKWLEWFGTTETDSGLIYSTARVIEPDVNAEQLFIEQHRTFQANKLAVLGEVAAGVAHELNNPLAIISGYLQIMDLENDESQDPKNLERKKVITAMMKASERATKIVDNLKSLSRDASKDRFESARFNEIIHASVSLLQNRFERHQVKFNFTPMPQDILIRCRRNELSQMFFNLLLNALEASQKDSAPWVNIETALESDRIVTTISNSGPSVPFELRGKIFNPFFSTKASGFGTGMGLAVAALITHQHGGSLMLDPASAVTTFVVKLPKLQDYQ